MPEHLIRGWIGCLMACAPFLVAAQAAPDLGVQQRRSEEREDAQRRALEAHPDVRMSSVVTALRRRLPDREQPCFPLARIDWQFGDSALPSWQTWLEAALAGPDGDDAPLGRCIGVVGVALLQDRAQEAVVRRGYITTRVVAPEQNLQSGELRFVVIPGRIRSIRPVGGGLRRQLRGAMPMQPGDILLLPDLEQALENLKRVPTAESEIQVEPAQTLAGEGQVGPGQSDLVVRYSQNLPIRLNLSVDDSGTTGTGKYVGSATLSYDNALNINDLLYLTLNLGRPGRKPADRGTQGYTVHYDVPWGYWLFGLTGSENRYLQRVAGLNGAIDYRGLNRAGEAALSRVVQRDQGGRTSVTLKGWRKSSQNFIDDTEVLVQRRIEAGWEMQLQRTQSFGSANFDGRLAYRHGTGALGSLRAPEETFGEGTSRLSLIAADAAFTVLMQWGAGQLRYGGQWRLQFNRTPLVPSDRFAIGGRYTVRGFDGEQQLSAERGGLWRNELALALPAPGHELYTGVDYGQVGGPSARLLAGTALCGAVLGLRGQWSKVQYDLSIGTPISKPRAFPTSPWSVGFSLHWSFGPAG